jgi:hypothetical protein
MQETKKLCSEISQQSVPETANAMQPSAEETDASALTGTVGRIAKWVTPTTVGDSSMREDGLNDVYFMHDIGLAGAVRTGVGVRFPDGTMQTTAALSAIAHDLTLTGNGTSPQPLGVAVPLTLSGSTPNGKAVLKVTNTGAGIGGIFLGGKSDIDDNDGLFVAGGDSPNKDGGNGVYIYGGYATGGRGGAGVVSVGGQGKVGGAGIDAFGGASLATATNSPAGRFWGNVEIYHYNGLHPDGNLLVSGTVTAGTGMFTIDHPLDPENKYLHHSSVESPDMMNVYNGNITTDAGGEAVVQLPDYFEALNQDFRYQLTVIGTFAQAIVASEIKDNRFLIKTNAPNVKVSWQVTGIRHDAFANAHQLKVEEDKPTQERGYYLHPAEHGQPEEKSAQQVRHPELLRRIKETREKAQPENRQ